MIQTLCGFYALLSVKCVPSFTMYVTVVFVFHTESSPLFSWSFPIASCKTTCTASWTSPCNSSQKSCLCSLQFLHLFQAISFMISWSWLFYSSSSDQFGDSVATPVLQCSALTTLTTKVVTWTVLGLVLLWQSVKFWFAVLCWQSVHMWQTGL